MVTVDPFGRMASTFPPGFSRISAPPPSEALISPMMGVGSAVTVDVSVGLKVALRVGVDVGLVVCGGTPMSAVDSAASGEAVMLGSGEGEIAVWVTEAGSGVASPTCTLIH